MLRIADDRRAACVFTFTPRPSVQFIEAARALLFAGLARRMEKIDTYSGVSSLRFFFFFDFFDGGASVGARTSPGGAKPRGPAAPGAPPSFFRFFPPPPSKKSKKKKKRRLLTPD